MFLGRSTWDRERLWALNEALWQPLRDMPDGWPEPESHLEHEPPYAAWLDLDVVATALLLEPPRPMCEDADLDAVLGRVWQVWQMVVDQWRQGALAESHRAGAQAGTDDSSVVTQRWRFNAERWIPSTPCGLLRKVEQVRQSGAEREAHTALLCERLTMLFKRVGAVAIPEPISAERLRDFVAIAVRQLRDERSTLPAVTATS